MSTILVTGGCGFIGTNYVLKKLIENKEDIFVYDSYSYASNHDLQFYHFSHLPHYNTCQGDIGDPDKVNYILNRFKPKAIINFAAETHVDNSISDPSPFIKTNINGTFNLLECSRKYWNENKDFRYIHISTDEVYGSLEKNELRFTEESQYKPNSPYSASKAASDHLVRAYYHTYGLPTVTTNCSNNYGRFQNKEKFIPKVISNILNNKKIPIYGDGQQIRDWLYVDDHCDAIDLVLEKGKIGETYNIGGNCELTNLEVVNRICSYMGKGKDLIEFVTDRPGHDRRYAINSNKIWQELFWVPKETFDTGLSKTIDYYIKKNENRI